MEYLSHVVVNASDDIEFDSQEDFAESVSAHVTSSTRGSSLLYPLGKGNHFKAELEKNVLENDEAIVFFSSSKDKMVACLKKWGENSQGKTHIASKRQLAIVCGSYAKGKKTQIGTFATGQTATISYNVKAIKTNFKIWKKRHKLNDQFFTKTAGYSMKEARRDALMYNFENNFYYCYVGMPKFGPNGVDMTVLTNHAINPLILATWLKEGKGATTI